MERVPGQLGHFARLGQQVEHPVEAREIVLELGHAGGEHGHGLQEHRQVDQEHHQVSQREPAVDDLQAAVEQEPDRGHGQEKLPEQLDQPRQPPGVELEPRHEVVFAHEPRRFALLAAERPDHPHAAEDFSRLAIDFLALFADVAKQRANAAVPEQVGIIHARYQQERTEQEPPVDPGQHDHSTQELDHGLARVVEHAEDQLADAAGILAQQARCTAGLELVNPVQGKPHRVFVDLAPASQPGPVSWLAWLASGSSARRTCRGSRPARPGRPARPDGAWAIPGPQREART